MHIKKILAMLPIFAVAALSSITAFAGHRSCCMCGKKVCVLEVSEETEDVTGFEVKAKEICIPGIKLPWDKCGTRRCGGVRSVCVLSEVKEEKTVCKYDWSIKTICTQCCKHHRLKHGRHHADVNRDEKIPFEYYVADLEVAGQNVLSQDVPVQTVSGMAANQALQGPQPIGPSDIVGFKAASRLSAVFVAPKAAAPSATESSRRNAEPTAQNGESSRKSGSVVKTASGFKLLR